MSALSGIPQVSPRRRRTDRVMRGLLLVGTLIALGTPACGAVAAVFAYRAIVVWLPAVSGIPALSRLRISVARWRVAQRECSPQAPNVCAPCDYPVAA